MTCEYNVGDFISRVNPGQLLPKRSLQRLVVGLGRLTVGLFIALGLFFSANHAVAQTDRSWLSKPYSSFSNEDTVRNFLEKMSSSVGKPAVVSDQITGTISGNLKKGSVKEILDLLNHVYSVVWYYDGANIYYYHSNEVSMTLMDFGGAEPAFVKKMLVDAGVWDKRFQWRSVPGYSAAYVSGPERLKELVREFSGMVNVQQAETDRLTRKAEVVPLKHVKAADERVVVDGEVQMVPGLVTTLRELVISAKGGEISIPEGKKGLSKLGANSPEELQQKVKRGIKAHETRNAVVLLDSPENIELYKSLIRQLDVPSRQVEIDVTIIDVVSDRINELGFDWNAIGEDGVLKLSEGLTADLIKSAGGAAQAAAGITSAEDIFRLRLEALASNGDAKILSQPSVVTMNNETASIDNTETFFVRLQGDEAVSLERIEVGSKLKVTPRVHDESGNSNIHLTIELEDGQRTGDAVDSLPIIRQTKIQTKSVVRSHSSLLVGGYYVERSENANVGVPVLKDIPLVGKLFRTERKREGNLVRMFLLTPKLRRGSDPQFDKSPAVVSHLREAKMISIDKAGESQSPFEDIRKNKKKFLEQGN